MFQSVSVQAASLAAAGDRSLAAVFMCIFRPFVVLCMCLLYAWMHI